LTSNQFHSLKLLKSEKEVQNAVITVLTTITNTCGLLSPRVKHGVDDQEPRSDGTFTYSENKTNGQEPDKFLASCMAT
jgi:hypothetical protein